MNYIQKPVKNFTKGRGDKRPEIIVIHLADGTKESVLQEFSNLATQKSSHYLICKNREIWQFVQDSDTAYANGLKIKSTSEYILERPDNPNAYSLSIENEGTRGDIFSDFQYEDNAQLVYELSEKWKIPLDRKHIIGHNEIRFDKACPLPLLVNRILKMAQDKKNAPIISPEKKIEELKIIQVSLLKKVLVALQAKLAELLAKIKT